MIYGYEQFWTGREQRVYDKQAYILLSEHIPTGSQLCHREWDKGIIDKGYVLSLHE